MFIFFIESMCFYRDYFVQMVCLIEFAVNIIEIVSGVYEDFVCVFNCLQFLLAFLGRFLLELPVW